MVDHLRRIDWFFNCGKYDGQDYIRVKTKSQALKSFTSRKWFGFANPIRNRQASLILPNFNDVESYNAKADEIYQRATDEVLQTQREVVAVRLEDDPKVWDALKMDIAGILWETEWSHLVAPMFYCPIILPIYEIGNLPCGWEGKAPPIGWKGNGPEDLPPARLRVY